MTNDELKHLGFKKISCKDKFDPSAHYWKLKIHDHPFLSFLEIDVDANDISVWCMQPSRCSDSKEQVAIINKPNSEQEFKTIMEWLLQA